MHGVRVRPNVTNPICWTCKNCSYKCAADCEHCVTQPSTEQLCHYIKDVVNPYSYASHSVTTKSSYKVEVIKHIHIIHIPLAIVVAKWHRDLLALRYILGCADVESYCRLLKHVLHLCNISSTSQPSTQDFTTKPFRPKDYQIAMPTVTFRAEGLRG